MGTPDAEPHLREIISRLQKSVEQLSGRLDQLVASISTSQGRHGSTAGTPAAVTPLRQQSFASYARAVHRGRDRIRRYFDQDLFGDPAFDILFDLFADHEEGRATSLTAARVSANVPDTTALRWIYLLAKGGILTVLDHPKGGRGKLVTLTPQTIDKMRCYLAEIASIPLARNIE